MIEQKWENIWERPWRIGEVELPHPLILAPMAGVTDAPYRILASRLGAAMCGMEMVSAKAIYFNNKGTESLLRVDSREGLCSLQLFGSDPYIVSEMAKRVEDGPFVLIDFNMGCPVPKVVGNGEGSALLQNLPLAGRILEALVKAVKKPVTVKIRKGFGLEDDSGLEAARIAQESGVAAVAVHGRSREQYYGGRADWEAIGRIKQSLRIPVIGNGDVDSPLAAVEMMRQTGCDGVMIGRAAQGDPWIFSRCLTYFRTGVLEDRPGWEEQKALVLEHGRLLVEEKGEYTAVREMRRHLAWYSAGLPGSADFRRMICTMDSMAAMEEAIGHIWREGRD